MWTYRNAQYKDISFGKQIKPWYIYIYTIYTSIAKCRPDMMSQAPLIAFKLKYNKKQWSMWTYKNAQYKDSHVESKSDHDAKQTHLVASCNTEGTPLAYKRERWVLMPGGCTLYSTSSSLAHMHNACIWRASRSETGSCCHRGKRFMTSVKGSYWTLSPQTAPPIQILTYIT